MQRKTIWMRYLIIGISVFVIIVSCGKSTIDPVHTVRYVYRNASDTDLEMMVYNSSGELFRTFRIPSGRAVLTHKSEEEGVPAVFHFYLSVYSVGTSVVVKFDNGKCLSYLRDRKDALFDVTKYDNYTEELLSKRRYSLEFIFKQSDLEQSKDCD